ncbi:MAG: exodeoxyribonuclease III [Chloroflexota bacterium]
MRIATWNVNSLKARQEAVEKWLARAEPDVLLIQETKLSDADAPVMPFRMLGYEMAHHGEGRWNGVAILSRVGIEGIVTNFGDGPVRDSTAGAAIPTSEDDFNPFGEARMVSAVCGGVRVASLYVPNGREVGSAFFEGKLRWFERLSRWLEETQSPDAPVVLAGDYNVTPADIDVWSPARTHGGTHVSEPERAALARLREWGLVDAYRAGHPEGGRYSWWDYRAGMFHRNEGLRIDLIYATAPVAARVVWAEIDREARKGPPTPSDHTPVVMDLDEPGTPFDAGWTGAIERISARTKPRP